MCCAPGAVCYLRGMAIIEGGNLVETQWTIRKEPGGWIVYADGKFWDAFRYRREAFDYLSEMQKVAKADVRLLPADL